MINILYYFPYLIYLSNFFYNNNGNIQTTHFIECFTHGLTASYLNYYKYPNSFLYSFNHFIVDTIYCIVKGDKLVYVWLYHHIVCLWILSTLLLFDISQYSLDHIHYMLFFSEITAPILALMKYTRNEYIKKIYAYSFYIIRFYFGPILFYQLTPLLFNNNSFVISYSIWAPSLLLTIYGVIFSHQIFMTNFYT